MDELIAMTKGGDVLEVHPSCVKAHETAGWRVVPPADPVEPEPAAPKRKKEPANG